MDGKKLRNYYHWLATKYFVTLTTQSGALAALRRRPQADAVRPAGVGRFRGDGEVLGAAHAMEQAFKASPACAARCPTSQLRKPMPALKSIVTAPPIFDPKGGDGFGFSTV